MKWRDEFATGIHNIDDQHRTIVAYITRFERIAGNQEAADDAHSLILCARKLLQFHFSVEESLMRILPYPYFVEHCTEHEREMRTMADIERTMQRGHEQLESVQLMRDCLIEHIVHGDRSLGHYALDLYGRKGPRGARPRAPTTDGLPVRDDYR